LTKTARKSAAREISRLKTKTITANPTTARTVGGGNDNQKKTQACKGTITESQKEGAKLTTQVWDDDASYWVKVQTGRRQSKRIFPKAKNSLGASPKREPSKAAGECKSIGAFPLFEMAMDRG